jgi:hypothetical protein
MNQSVVIAGPDPQSMLHKALDAGSRSGMTNRGMLRCALRPRDDESQCLELFEELAELRRRNIKP